MLFADVEFSQDLAKKVKSDIFLIFCRIARLIGNDPTKLDVKNYNKPKQNIPEAHCLTAYAMYLLALLKDKSFDFTKEDFEECQKQHYGTRQEAFSTEIVAELSLFKKLNTDKKSLINFYGDSESDFSPNIHDLDSISKDAEKLEYLSLDLIKRNFHHMRSFHRNEFKLNFIEDSTNLVDALSEDRSLLDHIRSSDQASNIISSLKAFKATADKHLVNLNREKEQSGKLTDDQIHRLDAIYNSTLEQLKSDANSTLTARKGFFAPKNNSLLTKQIKAIQEADSIDKVDKAIQSVIDGYSPKGGFYKIAHLLFKLKHGRAFKAEDTTTVKQLSKYRINLGLATAPAA